MSAVPDKEDYRVGILQMLGHGDMETSVGPWREANRALRDYVRQHILKTRKPESLDGLSWKLPGRIEGYEIVGDFDERRRRLEDEWVGCALKPSHRPFSGFVIWFPDGFLRLLGSKCGPKHFPGTFQATQERWRATLADEQLAVDFEQLAQKFPDVRRELLSAANLSSFIEFDRVLEAFRVHLDYAWRAITHAVDHRNGEMIVETYEDGGSFKAGGGRTAGNLANVKFERFGFISGKEALLMSPRPSALISSAAHQASLVEEILARRSPAKEEMRMAIRTAGKAVRQGVQAREGLIGLQAFMAPENLDKVARFLNISARRPYYRATSRGLQRTTDEHDDKVELRGELHIPELAASRSLALVMGAKER